MTSKRSNKGKTRPTAASMMSTDTLGKNWDNSAATSTDASIGSNNAILDSGSTQLGNQENGLYQEQPQPQGDEGVALSQTVIAEPDFSLPSTEPNDASDESMAME